MSENWAFGVRDYDSGSGSTMVDDYMGGMYFKFSDYTSGTPTTKTFTNVNIKEQKIIININFLI